MNFFRLTLTLSLAANLALVAVLIAGRAPIDAHPTTAPVVTGTTAATAPSVAANEVWALIQNAEPRKQIELLKGEGFPPGIIRAIITAQVMQGFAARRKAIEAAAETPYWLTSARDNNGELRALYREQAKVLKELLGPDRENGTLAALRRQVPELPDAKVEQVAEIRDRYDEMRSDLYAAARGSTVLPEEREKLNNLERQQRAELAAVLSPQELEDYELRLSNTASSMRSNLAYFEPTEQEFRAIFPLQRAFDDQFLMMSISSDEQRRARMDAQKNMEQQIKQALGDQRYTEYQRTTDYNYRVTAQLVARLELPADATNQVYSVQQDIQQRLQDVYRNRDLNGDARNAQLAALADEAKARISSVLTPRGFDAYKQYGGAWLQYVQPRPAP